ncbi:OmpA/MotB family protein [Sporolituus thermophilus]|uniref:Chemotaxis protein MotB n=1 Tax=Sporolituus thermophilus DSM 23256 TaxID=1123285 RepID=A0A1G7JWD4_9FIRM|nr:OmpA family protein [Sporolituus thermophilus]SDF29260.1 chemotaxis protein MotB [Sporolituus thermophilus DSM 23256]
MARKRGTGSGGGGHDATGMMRWLLTYADLITLLMVFFVVMYAMSSADQRKFNALKASLATALRTEGAGANLIFEYAGNRPFNQAINPEGAEKELEAFREIINQVQQRVKDPQGVGFAVSERGLTIRFLDSVLFDLGRADLRPDALPLLDAVAGALKQTDNYIRVEGHADNLPISTAQFPSNWELSAARSIAVTRYFIDKHGLEPRRLSSLGYGEYRPLYPNTSEANRAKNRRVDIVILRSEKAGGEIDAPQPAPRQP